MERLEQPAGSSTRTPIYGWIVGFCLLYLAGGLALPRPAYLPLERAWILSNGAPSAKLEMLYYGQLAWGLIGGLGGLGIGWAWARFRPSSGPASAYATGWCLFLLLLTWLAHASRTIAG